MVEKEVSIMCNLSQGIKEESEAKGEEKARTEIVLNMHKKGYSLDQIVEITNLDVSAVKVYKNEKTGVWEATNDLQNMWE